MAKNTPVLPATIDSLLEKGDVLVKRGDVWTYPGATNDPSGTNLRIPLEYVSDAIVQEAIVKGDLVANVVDPMGAPTSLMRPLPEGEAPVRVVDIAQAGSVELGTELPVNSRPTHDAARRPDDVPLVFQDPQQKVVTEVRPAPAPVAPAPAVIPVATASVAK